MPDDLACLDADSMSSHLPLLTKILGKTQRRAACAFVVTKAVNQGRGQ